MASNASSIDSDSLNSLRNRTRFSEVDADDFAQEMVLQAARTLKEAAKPTERSPAEMKRS